MKSSIKIDVDQDNKPHIRVEFERSDDLRDKMVGRFLDNYPLPVSFAKVVSTGHAAGDRYTFEIIPIDPGNLLEQISAMQASLKDNENWYNKV